MKEWGQENLHSVTSAQNRTAIVNPRCWIPFSEPDVSLTTVISTFVITQAGWNQTKQRKLPFKAKLDLVKAFWWCSTFAKKYLKDLPFQNYFGCIPFGQHTFIWFHTANLVGVLWKYMTGLVILDIVLMLTSLSGLVSPPLPDLSRSCHLHPFHQTPFYSITNAWFFGKSGHFSQTWSWLGDNMSHSGPLQLAIPPQEVDKWCRQTIWATAVGRALCSLPFRSQYFHKRREERNNY